MDDLSLASRVMSPVTHDDEKKTEYIPPYPVPTSAIPCTHPCLTIQYRDGDGRGVYATNDIAKDSILSHSPILLFTQSEIERTPLEHYTYSFTRTQNGQVEKLQALALGLGSLFNHSPNPNVGWFMNKQEGFITYRTTRDIVAGEALEICYGDVSWMPGQPARKADHDDTDDLTRDVFGIPY